MRFGDFSCVILDTVLTRVLVLLAVAPQPRSARTDERVFEYQHLAIRIAILHRHHHPNKLA